MMGLGKPTLCTKFEFATFSHCVNIEENPEILRSSPSLSPRPSFLLRMILWWALANPSCLPNLKSLASSVTEIHVLNDKFTFWATLWEVRGNIRTSSIARWKARSRLPFREVWTLFASSYGWYTNTSKSSLLKGVGHFGACLLYTSPSPRD